MARKRMIDPAIWESAYSKNWTSDDFLVMIAAISLADDSGRGKISEIRRNCEKMLTEKKLKKSLSDLSDSLKIYDDGLYFLPKWTEYQTINRPKASKFPPPPGEIESIITDESLINHGTISDRSCASEVKVSEVNLKEINVSEVKVNSNGMKNESHSTHISLSDFYSLFTTTFGETPTTQEKSQLSSGIAEFLDLIPIEEQFKIFSDLCQIMNKNAKKRTKAYLFGTLKLKQQDYCGDQNRRKDKEFKRSENNLTKNDMLPI